ncbi:hypothetical protein [Azospirillum halopraeferens]|uniref:O-linked N-acetylglucosamine transferase family protein n=1 Tax=Azospirillum halopraeferens TaxID=34010 RepID=UPI0004258036|nr:hypothetical protein [Azospirillum halopraeferens]
MKTPVAHRPAPLDDAMAAAQRCLGAGRWDEGLARLDALPGAVAATPAVLVMRGLLLLGAGRTGEARGAVRRALAVAPDHRDAHVLAVRVESADRRTGDADRLLRRGLRLRPDDAVLWRDAGSAAYEAGALGAAQSALRRALALAPADRRARAILATVCARLSAERRFLGDPEGALAAADRAVRLDPAVVAGWSARLFARLMLESTTGADLYADAAAAGRALGAAAKPEAVARRPEAGRPAGRPIAVGLLSTSLAQSSVRYFVEGLLRSADPSRIGFTLYDEPADGASDEAFEVPAGVRSVDARGLRAGALAARIADDGIDVLIDLMGHGWYGRRLAVLMARPAPHLVTAIGYPGTLGLPVPVHKLTDRLIHPPGGRERLHEVPLYLRHMHCYAPPPYAPPVSTPRGDGLVFVSFNQLSKLGPTGARAWAAALAAVPGSRLLLKRQDLARADREALLARLAGFGLPLDRIDFDDAADHHADHLAAYRRADVALDTYPYNGTTTTCEALWMGVPVITLVGDRETSRTGLSLLTAAGRSDLVAGSVEAFAACARRLADDADGRAAFRRDARTLLSASALCDAEAYANGLAGALERLVDGAPARP